MPNPLERALLSDGLYLILGVSFITVGIVSAALSLLRGRVNTLLIWLSIFAIADGLRLWIQSETLLLVFGSVYFFGHLRSAFPYLVPIPALLYLHDGGLVKRRWAQVMHFLTIFLVCMAMAALLFGPHSVHYHNNCVVMGIAIVLFIFEGSPQGADAPDFRIVRRGLLMYLILLLLAYVGGLFDFSLRLEPYGFTILLGCLGYVAATRTLEREDQLLVIEKELDLAKKIQLALLPAEFPASTHFRVEVRYIPATSVAGDLYDFLAVDNDKAGLFIADVSGHGVPAALISTMVKLAVTSQSKQAENPAQVLSSLNTVLCGNTRTQFVTAAYAYLDASRGELYYSAAGHPPMLHLRSGETTPIEENGLILALFPSATYRTATHSLLRGDRLFLYTDGVVEARNTEDVEFGQERLCDLLKQTAHLSTTQVADRVTSTIQRWSRVQEDDMTILVCDYI